VGSDYPGTLLREDSLGQLKTARDELGFRYVRFHAIFHDVLGTYRVVDGQPVYDWTKIDQLYDRLLKMGIKPFVELGFTPDAMKSSDQTIFWWKGNTSHPDPETMGGAWSTPSCAMSSSATARPRCGPGISRSGTSPTSTASGRRPTRRPISSSMTSPPAPSRRSTRR
jgi:hypothetical protein